MLKFEWNQVKAERNRRKHRVSFDEAVSVFADPRALTFTDTEHSDTEDRSRTYGISNLGRPLVVVPTQSGGTLSVLSVRARQRSMKKISTPKDDLDIPELRREQMGAGVRGKYFKRFTQGSNVVVLRPEIQKAFPTSEAVNKALASLLAFAHETQDLTNRKRNALRKPASSKELSRIIQRKGARKPVVENKI